jgi:hypothetical protein
MSVRPSGRCHRTTSEPVRHERARQRGGSGGLGFFSGGPRAKGVGPTITDKVLHHKRPWLFPIFDHATRQAMGAESAWRVLHAELQNQAAQFIYLEQWFAAQAAERGGVRLSRLRIHDILHWGHIARGGAERERLIRAGLRVLGRSSAQAQSIQTAGQPCLCTTVLVSGMSRQGSCARSR